MVLSEESVNDLRLRADRLENTFELKVTERPKVGLVKSKLAYVLLFEK
jgi:hypothetical protein